MKRAFICGTYFYLRNSTSITDNFITLSTFSFNIYSFSTNIQNEILVNLRLFFSLGTSKNWIFIFFCLVVPVLSNSIKPCDYWISVVLIDIGNQQYSEEHYVQAPGHSARSTWPVLSYPFKSRIMYQKLPRVQTSFWLSGIWQWTNHSCVSPLMGLVFL